MVAYSKGLLSRTEIINNSRMIFNEYGIRITLANLAEHLDITMGRLTYHFKNKDSLFIAIAKDYEEKLFELRKSRSFGEPDFNNFINTASKVMDLQYEYRCAMIYIVSSLQLKDDMRTHLHEAYTNNRDNIKKTVEHYVNTKIFKRKILDAHNYEVFLFQITTLFTNWIFNLSLYDFHKAYAEMKPIYMRGIFSVFLPYLTEKGSKELSDNGLFSD